MSPNSEFGLGQIGQIALPVSNLDRAVEFYQARLGMQHLFSVPNLAFFDCAGVRLMLEPGQPPAGSIIYFKVDDIQAAYQTLLSRGVNFEDTPHLIATLETHDLWMVFFRDSEHNLLSLMSEVPRKA